MQRHKVDRLEALLFALRAELGATRLTIKVEPSGYTIIADNRTTQSRSLYVAQLEAGDKAAGRRPMPF